MSENKEKIYIVLSQTGTILSKIIKFFTGAEYCHSSISLDESLTTMYSFGRVFANNPFYGGYVKESPNYGTFKKFYKTKAVVLEFEIDKQKYTEIKSFLEEMYKRRKRFGYNYFGLVSALFRKKHKSPNRFYCSEFVREIMLRFGIILKGMLPEVARPNDFISTFADKTVYTGSLQAYCKAYRPIAVAK